MLDYCRATCRQLHAAWAFASRQRCAVHRSREVMSSSPRRSPACQQEQRKRVRMRLLQPMRKGLSPAYVLSSVRTLWQSHNTSHQRALEAHPRWQRRRPHIHICYMSRRGQGLDSTCPPPVQLRHATVAFASSEVVAHSRTAPYCLDCVAHTCCGSRSRRAAVRRAQGVADRNVNASIALTLKAPSDGDNRQGRACQYACGICDACLPSSKLCDFGRSSPYRVDTHKR